MRERWTANAVLDMLREGPFRTPAHVWLHEVRNRTGYGVRDRYADAIVVSVWPSRGIWLAGVEVKCNRSDWLRELDQPAKSAEIQRWCDYWWIAAPAGVVEPSEVPETWGLLTTGGKRVVRAKEAPKLPREEWAPPFVASLVRNAAEAQERVRRDGYDAGYQTAAREHGVEKHQESLRQLSEAEREVRRLRQELEWRTRELAALRGAVAAFEDRTGVIGIANGGAFGARNAAGMYRLASALAGMDPDALATTLRSALASLTALAELKQSATAAALPIPEDA